MKTMIKKSIDDKKLKQIIPEKEFCEAMKTGLADYFSKEHGESIRRGIIAAKKRKQNIQNKTDTKEISKGSVKKIKEHLNKLKKIFKGDFQISQISHFKNGVEVWEKPDIYYFCETKEDAEKIGRLLGILKSINEEGIEVDFFGPPKKYKSKQ